MIASNYPVCDVAILTKDRDAELRRCLTSLHRYLDRLCYSGHISIFDGSTRFQQSERTKIWLREYSGRTGVRIAYAGLESRANFIKALVQRGFSNRMVQFVLNGEGRFAAGPGANRNAQLLHYAGKCFITSDDDVIYRITDFRHGEQTTVPAARISLALDVHFAASTGVATQRTSNDLVDVLSMHRHILSGQANSTIHPEQFGADAVAISMSGVVGDSGMPNTTAFALSNGVVRGRFLSHSKMGTGVGMSRSVIRGVQRPRLALDQQIFTTTLTGFNNDFDLPPFTPSFKGEDTMLGGMLRILRPDLRAVHLPIGVLHIPSRERRYGGLPYLPGIPQIIVCMIGRGLSSNSHPHHSYQCAGDYLVYLTATETRFKAEMLEAHRAILSAWRDYAKLSLEENSGEPTDWAQGIERWIAKLTCAMHESRGQDTVRIQNFVGPVRIQDIRDYCEAFGVMLQAWLFLKSEAKNLVSQGAALAVELT